MKRSSRAIYWLCATFMVCTSSHAADEQAEPATEVEVYPVYDSNWASYVALGAQFLPDYDEEGRSSGLSKQQFFASMTVDGRFNDDDVASGGVSNPLNTPFHTGVTLSLLGTPIKREDRPSVSPTEFNDVAQTIVSSLYFFSPSLYRSEAAGHHIGPLVRIGAISRESLGESGDSVNWFYSIGVQYSSMKFLDSEPVKGIEPRNGVPEGYIRLSAARFEDYAGLGRRTRMVADAALRIYPKLNMFLGVQGNFGEGPDEFMLVISMVRQPHEIANLFSLGKEE
jgi:hypothetical protein